MLLTIAVSLGFVGAWRVMTEIVRCLLTMLVRPMSVSLLFSRKAF